MISVTTKQIAIETSRDSISDTFFTMFIMAVQRDKLGSLKPFYLKCLKLILMSQS